MNELIATILKCDRNLGVTAERGPPGGAMADTHCTFSNVCTLLSCLSYLQHGVISE